MNNVRLAFVQLILRSAGPRRVVHWGNMAPC
jgi:hypothetical protein